MSPQPARAPKIRLCEQLSGPFRICLDYFEFCVLHSRTSTKHYNYYASRECYNLATRAAHCACYSACVCALRKSVRCEGGDRTMLGGDRGTRGVP
jgi:hypothetical protein